MTPQTLAIGQYSDPDKAALISEFQATVIPDLAELPGLSINQRKKIRAVAYYGHGKFDGRVMDQLPKLELIANFGVGYDAIDISDANSRNIKVTNTPNVLNDDVADLAVGMLLAQRRALVLGDNFVRSGVWSSGQSFPLTQKLSHGRAGILGLGRIGREIADRLSAFKMEIHYHSRMPKATPGWIYHSDAVALARAVDYLIVALVGGQETNAYVSQKVIAALGPKGILINISRGTTVDEEALIQALSTGTIAGAGLDVFLNEPSIDPRFYDLENVLLQPHQGSGTVETRSAMARLQRDNISAFLSGLELKTPVKTY